MSNLNKEIYTNEAALLTNLFDSFSKEDNQINKEEFRNLVSFIFIINESTIHEFEIQSDEHLTESMNQYHDSLAKEKTNELSVFFPNKPNISLEEFLNTLMINPIPYNWEKLTYLKELCIDSYSNAKIFNYIANKFNQVLNTTIPLLPDNTPTINIKPLEIYNNNPPIYIQPNQMAYDVIDGDVKILDFIKEDNKNIAIYYSNNWYLNNKDQIENMMDISKPDNEVVYKCNQVTGLIPPENIDKTKVFFRLRKLGLPLDFVPIENIQALIQSPNQYFIIEITNEKIDTVVSNNVLFHRVDWLGVAHCQEGQGGKICLIKILKPEIQQGGKKKRKTQKHQKYKKKISFGKKSKRRRKNKKQLILI